MSQVEVKLKISLKPSCRVTHARKCVVYGLPLYSTTVNFLLSSRFGNDWEYHSLWTPCRWSKFFCSNVMRKA